MPDLRVDARTAHLPVVVIGAGPSGLAAAAHLRHRDLDVVVLEAGLRAGAAVREWGHVRLFSPWSELVDPQAAKVLADAGWAAPDPAAWPTGEQWATHYLQPLADALDDAVRYGATVTGVARHARDRLVDSGREGEAFTVHVRTAAGDERVLARAVVDASGTWSGPNPLRGDGLLALGEAAAAERVTYRMPDFRDDAVSARYTGKHVVVAGTGASAKGALIGLATLAEADPATRVTWLVRRSSVGEALTGSGQDQLEARGELGRRAARAVESFHVTTLGGFRTAAVTQRGDGQLDIESFDGQRIEGVDEVVVLTGFRPDLSFLSEVRLDLDPVLQAPRALAPLIDPNVHSCGTVHPHGAAELSQPEDGFYLVGMKSYGRATSFLMLTGFEQTRSVAAAIAGDHAGAARVELTLPDTGVCGSAGDFDVPGVEGGGCCGAPAAQELITLGRPGS